MVPFFYRWFPSKSWLFVSFLFIKISDNKAGRRIMIHRLLLLFCITASLSRGSAISIVQESSDTISDRYITSDLVNAWPNNPDSPGAGTSKQDWRYDDQTIQGDTTTTKKASALGLEKPSTSSSVIDSGKKKNLIPITKRADWYLRQLCHIR